MELSETLISLRRQRGYSQEQLADLLGISRQAVGKWEVGQSVPDLQKLIALADLFGVTLDELVRGPAPGSTLPPQNGAASVTLPEGTTYALMPTGREYKSKTTVFGLPLVHINFGYGFGKIRVAKGIFALGNISIGVVSMGGIALGGLAFGGISIGLIALAGLAIGGFALGGLALGYLALGGAAIGAYALGGAAIASKVAVGGAAFGGVASMGANPGAGLIVTDTLTVEAARAYLQAACPHLPAPLLWLFSLGSL